MHYQPNKAGFYIGFAIALPLLGFTGWRDWDLLAAILPASQVIAAFFGLAALDGGFLGWGVGFMKAKGNDQRMIAGILCGICFIGTSIGLVLDLVMNVANKGYIADNRSDLYMGAIILIAVAVLVNVGGGFMYALNDPKSKQDMRDQVAHDKINDLADAQIAQHAAMFAPQFAQAKVAVWLQQAQMIHGINQPIQQLPPPTVQGSALPSQQQQLQQQSEPQSGFFGKLGAGIGQMFNRQQPPVEQQPSTPVQPVSQIDMQRLNELVEAYHASGDSGLVSFPDWLAKVQSSPLVQSPLPSQASQPGSQNGAH